MLSGLMNFFSTCFQPTSKGNVHTNPDTGGHQDGLLWYKDHGHHVIGEFSMAVVQANNLLEDQSQLESGSLSLDEQGPYGTFVGVYDGHGGPETSRYVNNHLISASQEVYFRATINVGGCDTEGLSGYRRGFSFSGYKTVAYEAANSSSQSMLPSRSNL